MEETCFTGRAPRVRILLQDQHRVRLVAECRRLPVLRYDMKTEMLHVPVAGGHPVSDGEPRRTKPQRVRKDVGGMGHHPPIVTCSAHVRRGVPALFVAPSIRRLDLGIDWV